MGTTNRGRFEDAEQMDAVGDEMCFGVALSCAVIAMDSMDRWMDGWSQKDMVMCRKLRAARRLIDSVFFAPRSSVCIAPAVFHP
jgi:hypothetical protein